MTRHRKGENHPSAKLTAEQARAIYQDPRTSFEISLDLDFDITLSAINHIRRGDNWAEATKGLTPGRIPEPQNLPSEEIVRGVFLATGTQREIAKRFKISKSAVSRIKRRAAWKHITRDLP